MAAADNSIGVYAVVRVVLPFHLKTLAGVSGEVTLEVEGSVTKRAILDAIEARYPVLRGTMRDRETGARRPMVRFFACQEDFSDEPAEAPLPAAIADGKEPFLVVGAISGG